MTRNEFIEGSSLAETAYHALFVRIRLTHVLGLMSNYALWRRDRKESDPKRDDFLREFCLKHQNKLLLWGEHAIPQFLAYYFYFRTIDATCVPDKFLLNLITTIATANAPNGSRPLFNPYYTIEETLPFLIGTADDPLDDDFNEASYTLEALIHLFVPRNWKQAMFSIWPATTRVSARRFKPAQKWGYYFWRCDKGRYEEKMSTPNQKWDDLKATASEHKGNELPKLIKNVPILYLCFLCVFPHRLHANGVRWVASELEAIE